MVERDCARSWLQLEDEDEDHRVRIHEHDEARLLHLWEYTYLASLSPRYCVRHFSLVRYVPGRGASLSA